MNLLFHPFFRPHKLHTPRNRTRVGAIVWFVTAGIATACGVGGGGIYVPMGILLLRFPPKPSSGLSQASIFGACLGGLIVNIRNRHPDEFIRDTKGVPSEEHPGKIVPYEKNMTNAEAESDRERYLQGGDGQRKFFTRPLIDYDMALFLAPMEMAGAVLGVIVQRLFPNWLFLSLATIILGYTCYKTYVKFFASYKKDKLQREERRKRQEMEESTKRTSMSVTNTTDADSNESGDISNNVNGDNDDVETITKENPIEQELDDPKELEQRRRFLQDDSRQYPIEKLAALLLLWVGLTIITFLKGGKGVDSIIGITCKDPVFYVLVASQFLWTFGFASFFGYRNMKRTEARKAVGYPFHEMDVLVSF